MTFTEAVMRALLEVRTPEECDHLRAVAALALEGWTPAERAAWHKLALVAVERVDP